MCVVYLLARMMKWVVGTGRLLTSGDIDHTNLGARIALNIHVFQATNCRSERASCRCFLVRNAVAKESANRVKWSIVLVPRLVILRRSLSKLNSSENIHSFLDDRRMLEGM